MPRLMVPSNGGGTKVMRTFREAAGVALAVAVPVGSTAAAGEVSDEGAGSWAHTDPHIAHSTNAIAETILVVAREQCDIGWTENSGERFRDLICKNKQLGKVAPVHVREQIVAPFAIGQEIFVYLLFCDAVVKTIEPDQVIHGTFTGVLSGSAVFHEERPIARLGQQKFAG